MIRARGSLLSLLHLLRSGFVLVQNDFMFSVFLNDGGGYTFTYYSGCKYEAGSITELLLAVGDRRAMSLGWELHHVVL